MPIIRAKNRIEEYAARAKYLPAAEMAARPADANRKVSENVVSFLEPSEGAILDVGCGDGALLGMLKGERIGIAPSMEEVTKLRTLWPSIRFEVGLAQSLPIPDKSISTLICNSVLLVLDGEAEVLKALQEFARVCRGSIFIGEVPIEPDGRFPKDSIRTWLAALFRQYGPKGLLAGIRDVILAATTDKPLLFYPDAVFTAHREEFISLCSTTGLTLVRDRITPHMPTRRDYLFTYGNKPGVGAGGCGI